MKENAVFPVRGGDTLAKSENAELALQRNEVTRAVSDAETGAAVAAAHAVAAARAAGPSVSASLQTKDTSAKKNKQ